MRKKTSLLVFFSFLLFLNFIEDDQVEIVYHKKPKKLEPKPLAIDKVQSQYAGLFKLKSDRDRTSDQERALENKVIDQVDRQYSAPKRDLHSLYTQEKIEYQVKSTDTLMLIAFELYGDHRMWRRIYSWNKNVIGPDYELKHAPLISVFKPTQQRIRPQGYPYLIKKGDSLSLISTKVYGEMGKWRRLFENNRDQIYNPNLIFAGFTLYYPPYKEVSPQQNLVF